MYRSYFLHTLQDQRQSLQAAQEKVIFDHDCQGPLTREIESMYHAWCASQGGPLRFFSLCQRQDCIDLDTDIPFDIPTLLSADQATYFYLYKDRMQDSTWQVEDHIGFSVVLRSRPNG